MLNQTASDPKALKNPESSSDHLTTLEADYIADKIPIKNENFPLLANALKSYDRLTRNSTREASDP